ncbi:MAG TPA: glycosyltransferase family 2 protein [Fimbriimonadaceae bacterium]|nr:glycosyltransferase family 2 protein [Fimbriimonadaceae bacterium]
MGRQIAVQIVFYNQRQAETEKLLKCLEGLKTPLGFEIVLRTGDCGDRTEIDVETWRNRLHAKGIAWTHAKFGENLGFGQGQNRLFATAPADLIWMVNPDALFTSTTLRDLCAFASRRPGWGMVEPRLSPIEHPKCVDARTCETAWCSGCAPLVDARLYERVNGFDEAFFLYSEDVDLSWRIKAAGGGLYCCPSASVFHYRDEALSGPRNLWIHVSELLLLAKYGRKGFLTCRLADWLSAEPPLRDEIFSTFAEASTRLKGANPAERAAASWSGRLNAPLRWQPQAVEAFAGPETPAVVVDGQDASPGEVAECALSLWACGIPEISIDLEPEPASRLGGLLPFELEPEPHPEAVRIKATVRAFSSCVDPQRSWISRTVPSDQGWLASSIEAGIPAPSVLERLEDGGSIVCYRDAENWRSSIRLLRAKARLIRAPASAKSLLRTFALP